MIWDLILNAERRGTTIITQAFQASYTLNPECVKSLGKGLGEYIVIQLSPDLICPRTAVPDLQGQSLNIATGEWIC